MRPGFDGKAGTNQGFDGLDFASGNGGGLGAGGDDGANAGDAEDADAAAVRETAEDVAGEEGKGHFLEAVGPAATGAVERQGGVGAGGGEVVEHGFLVIGLDDEGVPVEWQCNQLPIFSGADAYGALMVDLAAPRVDNTPAVAPTAATATPAMMSLLR